MAYPTMNFINQQVLDFQMQIDFEKYSVREG
jgi:hypothetical protein